MSVAIVTLESPTQTGRKNPCSDLESGEEKEEEEKNLFMQLLALSAGVWLGDAQSHSSSPRVNL